jgi:hypothetical protein
MNCWNFRNTWKTHNTTWYCSSLRAGNMNGHNSAEYPSWLSTSTAYCDSANSWVDNSANQGASLTAACVNTTAQFWGLIWAVSPDCFLCPHLFSESPGWTAACRCCANRGESLQCVHTVDCRSPWQGCVLFSAITSNFIKTKVWGGGVLMFWGVTSRGLVCYCWSFGQI